MTIVPLQIIACVERRGDTVPLLHAPGEAALVRRGHDRLLVMRCPCGCGDDVLLNLDLAAGPAWRLYRTSRGASVFPSVWRDTGCGSHFVVWDDRVLMLGEFDSILEVGGRDLRDVIIGVLRARNAPAHFGEVAEQVSEVPWAVLGACQQLVAEKRVVEIRVGWFTAR